MTRSGLTWIALASAAAGVMAALHYAALDLTLSHYDAKAHLVVARRVADSLTPGWKQFGGVWLPLPHVLNTWPVQVDSWYRTGLSGAVISVLGFVLAATALAALTWRLSGSRLAAATAWAVFAGNPNVLYLQSTPMTEALLFGLLAASALAVTAWAAPGSRVSATWPGVALALAVLTRYEAWPVAPALLVAAWMARARADGATAHAWRTSLARVIGLAMWPAIAIGLFLVNSRVSTGVWFTTGGFFVAENEAHGNPLSALWQVGWGGVRLMGPWTATFALAGAPIALWWARQPPGHRRARAWMTLALAGTAALPFYAFLQGHPFRIRYMVALVLATAVLAGFAVAAWPRRWLRLAAAALVIGTALVETPPLDPSAPMVVEAQWDRPNIADRASVTAQLAREFDRPRHKILASMGSLAHYMQEMASAGFRLDDFVHEGTDDVWPDALEDPRRHVQWILFEEKAEGGDVLTQRRERFPAFVQGFARVAEAAGVALYRRDEPGDRHLP